jgi:uncharacterized membrane protein YeaQ/YmgE (transglycosylase-associated protein family)
MKEISVLYFLIGGAIVGAVIGLIYGIKTSKTWGDNFNIVIYPIVTAMIGACFVAFLWGAFHGFKM